MSSRNRRHYGSRGVSRSRRRKAWVNTGHITSALTSGQYEWTDLIQGLTTAVTFSDTGVTALRTHLWVTPTSTPATGDTFFVTVGVVRNTDIGANVVGAILPTQADYPWSFQRQYAFLANYNGLGGNTIELDIRAMRKVTNDFQAYAVGIDSGAAAATAYRIFARTLIALP